MVNALVGDGLGGLVGSYISTHGSANFGFLIMQ